MSTTNVVVDILAVIVALSALILMWSLGRAHKRIAELEKDCGILWGLADERGEQIRSLDDRNERLHEDLRRMRERLPQLADEPVVDEDPVRAYIPEWERMLLENPDRFGKTFGVES